MCVMCGKSPQGSCPAWGDAHDIPSMPPQPIGHGPGTAAPPDLTRDAADAPGFLTKVKNFASAAAQHVAAGMPMCTDEEIIARHDICLKCEHLVNNACNLCGCPVARAAGYVSKLSWADQECPAGKWGKIRRRPDVDDSKATG